MQIIFNQKPVEVEEGASVLSALTLFGVPMQHIAVAVNKQIVRRDEWDSKILKENDDIMVITAVKGG
ncbi:MAG: sulfur carrier protein ThiS [Bacteroides sp.]|nr:sulfur carrier protein ThiS [Bacteroides sp.]